MVDQVQKYPADYHIIIADENLDVYDDQACRRILVSGSKCIENRLSLLEDSLVPKMSISTRVAVMVFYQNNYYDLIMLVKYWLNILIEGLIKEKE